MTAAEVLKVFRAFCEKHQVVRTYDAQSGCYDWRGPVHLWPAHYRAWEFARKLAKLRSMKGGASMTRRGTGKPYLMNDEEKEQLRQQFIADYAAEQVEEMASCCSSGDIESDSWAAEYIRDYIGALLPEQRLSLFESLRSSFDDPGWTVADVRFIMRLCGVEKLTLSVGKEAGK